VVSAARNAAAAVLVLAVLGVGCNAPNEVPDVSYDDRYGSSTMMDFYLPDDGAPVHSTVMFIHGGGWAAGSKDHERLEVMLREIGRMGQVLEEFRGFTRPLSGLRLQPTDLGDLLHYVALLEEADAPARGVELTAPAGGVVKDVMEHSDARIEPIARPELAGPNALVESPETQPVEQVVEESATVPAPDGGHITWTEDGIRYVVRGYTREAGVRNLERQFAAICRKATRQFAEGRTEPVTVDPSCVEAYLGAPRFEAEDLRDRVQMPGVTTGLAWTPVGGDVLFVEAIAMPGEKGLLLTGQLGDVMKESAQAALSWVRAHQAELAIPEGFFEKHDIHVHVPQGAVPKDGPSAGVTMTTSIVSLATGRPTKPLLAMTGEISLSGRVLPIGGVKEKTLAAHRAGVRILILPDRNRKDYEEEVPEDIRAEITVHYVTDLKQVLDLALEPESSRANATSRSVTKTRRRKEPAGV
jgi:hypothetical protein